MAYPRHVSPVERTIIDNIINAALKRKYTVSVDDLKRSADYDQITAEIAATDITTLIFYTGGRKIGWIFLVHGNEKDVVSDYNISEYGSWPEILELIPGEKEE